MSDSRESSDDRLMNETEAAEILKLNVKTLRNYRALQRGPKWVKLGRSVRYWLSDVLAYAQNSGAPAFLMLCAEMLGVYG